MFDLVFQRPKIVFGKEKKQKIFDKTILKTNFGVFIQVKRTF